MVIKSRYCLVNIIGREQLPRTRKAGRGSPGPGSGASKTKARTLPAGQGRGRCTSAGSATGGSCTMDCEIATEPIGTGQRFDFPARPVRLAWQWAPPDRSENPCRVTLLPRPVAEAVVAVLASRKCITVSGARRTRPYIVDSGHARWEQVDKFLAKPLAGCSFPKKLS
jgi:hypothetical protein